MAAIWQILTMVLSVVIKERQGVYNIEQRANMWVTWANRTGQESFCLSPATPSDPFCTCLIGIPLDSMEEFRNWTRVQIYGNLSKAWSNWCTTNQNGMITENWCEKQKIPRNPLGAQAFTITQGLNTTSQEPQELDILGSVPGNYCLFFEYYKGKELIRERSGKTGDDSAWISPVSSWYYNITAYCANWTWSVSLKQKSASMLPPGVFLIYGDRAWPAIPQKALGGLCYFGKLTLFAPSIQQMLDIRHKFHRPKHSVHLLGSDCKDNVELWNRPSVILASLFTPGVASSQALTQLKQLACWTGKQINIISEILNELTTDVGSIHHAVLQDRAAIDFLLLAQGHGCEDFEGMCCMDLSDHSESIHKKLSLLKENMKKLTVVENSFDKWLKSWGITGWLKDLVHFGIMILCILFSILLILPCLLCCVHKIIDRAFKSVWLVQKQSQGTVESFLQIEELLLDNGHIQPMHNPVCLY
ncbi:uncharacterized protein LOC118700791 [Molothrus ater]|uniref:uncharacterized protein LOC118700791 n=1 Tax=Molothrus ater TaxID=84834 RepID=UPI001749144D|nr:uncharacterized protein LOC118700791 [Molothrus ater]